MNHVMIGAGIPFLLALPFLYRRRGRVPLSILIALPLAMIAGAVWAVVPDIPRVTGHSDLYLRLMNDPRMNVFFWHYRIDQIETESSLYSVGVAALLAALMAVSWNELRISEKT